jgi:hypothetical protein
VPDQPLTRYILAVAHQAGPDPKIRKGADGGRDYFSPAELEKAAWAFMDGPREVGTDHADGTVGIAKIVESYCWPEGAPDWPQPDGSVITSGDWLIGMRTTEQTYQEARSGRFGGVSVQGAARRIKPGAR